MAGTVERYGKGFRYRVQLGADPGTGKRRWATKGGFATEKEATKAMHRVIVAADDGLVVKRSTLRLGQYLTEWLERVTPDLKATTAAGYGRAVTKLDDKLGQVRVQDLTPLQIEQVYVGLVKDGLAPKTVRNLHSVLRRALADAERLGLVMSSDQAKAAAEFYCSVFGDGKITTDSGMVVNFELSGQKFMGLNGGPQFKFDEAVSFVVNCKTQEEIDYYWEKLTEEGGQESMCGWLKDKFGVSWQIVPSNIGKLMSDPEKAQRVMPVLMGMKKIDIKKLETKF